MLGAKVQDRIELLPGLRLHLLLQAPAGQLDPLVEILLRQLLELVAVDLLDRGKHLLHALLGKPHDADRLGHDVGRVLFREHTFHDPPIVQEHDHRLPVQGGAPWPRRSGGRRWNSRVVLIVVSHRPPGESQRGQRNDQERASGRKHKPCGPVLPPGARLARRSGTRFCRKWWRDRSPGARIRQGEVKTRLLSGGYVFCWSQLRVAMLMEPSELSPLLEPLLEKIVIVDLSSSYVCLGTFVACDTQVLE